MPQRRCHYGTKPAGTDHRRQRSRGPHAREWLNAKSDEKPVVVYKSLEETRAALRERGMDPDVIEAAMEPKFLRDEKKKEEVRGALRERGIDPDILEAAPDVLAAIGLKLLEYKKPDPVP